MRTEPTQPSPTSLPHPSATDSAEPKVSGPVLAKEIPEPVQPIGWWLAAVSVGMFLASLAVGWIMPLELDSIWYLHTWWMYGQGYVGHQDFYASMPGLWILLAPLTWFPWTPRTWLAFGQAMVAVLFGLSVWLTGRLVRARRWEALMLGAVCLVILLRTEFFMFRRAYFETTLVLVHLVLLDGLPRSSRVGWISGLAGWSIGTVCMSSQRGVFYLPIQPIYLVWLYWRQWRMLRRALAGWVLGGLVSAVPTLAYIAYHNAWIDEWTWNVVFPAEINTHFMSMGKYVRVLVYGLLLFVGWMGGIKDKTLPTPTKILLAIASIVSFWAMMICCMPYTRSILFLLIAGMGIPLVRTVLVWWVAEPSKRDRIGFVLAAMALGVMAAADGLTTECPYSEWPRQAHLRNQQLQLLDWLAKVSGGEPVVAVEPYHPMLVPDATFVRGGYWHWMPHPLLKSKLVSFAEQVLAQQPPLIIATLGSSTDLIKELMRLEIIRKEQADRLLRMLRHGYVLVCFPEIGKFKFPSAQAEFGNTFWIRRDRWQACPPPEIPYQVQTPTFSPAPLPAQK